MATPTLADWLPVLLQNSDSLFPTGAYAHSGGLEEIVRLGLATDGKSLQDFLREQVVPALENLELPYVRLAHEAGQKNDLALLAELSAEISAWKLGREPREASLQMGRARLQAARKAFPDPHLEELALSSLDKHLIIVYGWQLARLPLEPVLLGYYYQTVAGTCSAALKLIRLGQEGMQRILRETLGQAGSVIAAAQGVAREDAGWFNPVLDLAGLRHERAEERLFIS